MAKKTNYTKNGVDYYRITATVGFDNNGKRIRKEFLGKSKKDAIEKRDLYLAEIDKGLDAGFEKIELGDFFEEWFEVVHKPTITQITYNRYEGIHRMWIAPSSFYNIKLVNLKSIHIQKHLNQIESRDTAKRVYLLLSTFFKYCLKERIIIYSPLDNVSSPKVESTDTMKYLSRDSVALLTDAYKNDKELLIYILDLMTGLRQGELCALTHADIDFNDMTVDINKSLVRVSVPDKDGIKRSTFQIGPPKTKAGIRKIPLPKSLVLPLKEHIVNEKKKHLKLGITFNPDNPLFTTRTCTYLRGDHLNKRWKNLQEKLDIEPIIPFHGIRHTFCTMLAEKGVPLKTAATLMGHAKVETTARVYTHVDQKAKEDAVDLLEGIL